MAEKIVITGITGFIGGIVAEGLSRKGYSVTGISRGIRPGRFYDAAGWENLDAAVEGAAAVINLAGENIASGLWTKKKQELILKSRVEAGRRVAEAVRRAAVKPGVLIQPSAAGYYGNSGDAEVVEASPAGDTFLSRVCTEWEDSVQGAGVRTCIARLGVVLGKGGFLEKYSIPFKFYAGAVFGNGRQYISWISDEDLAAVFEMMIIKRDMQGAYNVCAPIPAANREFAFIYGRAVKRPVLLSIPSFALKAVLGRLADEMFLGGQRAVPERLLREGFSFKHKTAESAVEAALKTE